MGFLEKSLPVGKGDHLVVFAVNDKQRRVDVAHLAFVVEAMPDQQPRRKNGKLLERHGGHGAKGAFEHHARGMHFGGKLGCRTAAQRASEKNDSLGGNTLVFRQKAPNRAGISVASLFARPSGALAVAAVIIQANRKAQLVENVGRGASGTHVAGVAVRHQHHSPRIGNGQVPDARLLAVHLQDDVLERHVPLRGRGVDGGRRGKNETGLPKVEQHAQAHVDRDKNPDYGPKQGETARWLGRDFRFLDSRGRRLRLTHDSYSLRFSPLSWGGATERTPGLTFRQGRYPTHSFTTSDLCTTIPNTPRIGKRGSRRPRPDSRKAADGPIWRILPIECGRSYIMRSQTGSNPWRRTLWRRFP